MHLQIGPSVEVGKRGILVMLFNEMINEVPGAVEEITGDEKITFVFQFTPSNDEYFKRNLEEGAKKVFSEVAVKYPFIEPDTFHRNPDTFYASLLFSRTVKGVLRYPERFLQATKNRLQKIVDWAELEALNQSEKEIEESFRASDDEWRQARREYFENFEDAPPAMDEPGGADWKV